MKNNCRKSLMALVLVLAFSSSTFADDGIMWSEHGPPPPPPPSMSGEIHTDVASDGIIWTESMTEIGLGLVQALSRF
jgi:hypothetical protein